MMGSSERPQECHVDDEEVDLDADTKESTEDVFCDEETAESPHKITLWYKPDTSKPVVDHFPKKTVHRQIGLEVTLGRNKTADVLLYEKHMARNFATVTCRINAARRISFVLRNACDATKQKRIIFTDTKGHKTDLLPTQEVELSEQTTFKLECVEFIVGIELGDVNSKSFELVVKPVRGESDGSNDLNRSSDVQTSVHWSESVQGSLQLGSSLDTAHIGLPLTNSLQSGMNPTEQVIPKHVASPLMSQGCGQGYGVAVGPGSALPMSPMMSYQYQAGYQPLPQYHVMNPYPQNGHGYCEIQQPRTFLNQPSALHNHGVMYQHPSPAIVAQSQLVERGGGYSPLSPDQCCSQPYQGQADGHNKSSHRMDIKELAQALSSAHVSHPNGIPSPRGVITTPSSQDQNPVLYPSPANPRFRFPQSAVMPLQTGALGPNPDLSDLPRGPPLAQLNSGQGNGQSINLHPQIPANVVTTHAVSETGRSRTPVQHEDKPK